jgi:hypothetical protein
MVDVNQRPNNTREGWSNATTIVVSGIMENNSATTR